MTESHQQTPTNRMALRTKKAGREPVKDNQNTKRSVCTVLQEKRSQIRSGRVAVVTHVVIVGFEVPENLPGVNVLGLLLFIPTLQIGQDGHPMPRQKARSECNVPETVCRSKTQRSLALSLSRTDGNGPPQRTASNSIIPSPTKRNVALVA